MKKVLALVLSLCMLLSCVAFAENGVNGHVKVDVQGETQVDYTFSIAQDEDGCYQLSANGTAKGDTQDIFLQIGKEALVLGSQGEFVQISYEDLIAALQEALPKALTEEQMIAVGVIYYLFTGLEDDMQIASGVLSNELNRLVSIAMQQGVISYTRDGIVFEANLDQLFNLFKAYVAALAQDPSVLQTLSKTQLWSLLKLSENGEQEQAYLASFSEQVAQLTLPENAPSLYIKAIIGMDQSIVLDVDFATADGETSLNLDASYSGNSLSIAVKGLADGVNYSAAIDAVQFGETVTVEGNLAIEDKSGKLVAEGNLVTDGSVLTSAGTLSFASDYASIDAVAKYDADLANGEFAGSLVADITSGGETGNVDVEYSFDKVNGLYYGAVLTNPDGTKNAVYVNGNAQKNEYGAQANFSVDLIVNDEAIDSFIAAEAVISDVITVHAHCKGLNSIDNGEGEAYASAGIAALNQPFSFDFSLNLENAKLDAALIYDSHTLAIDGALGADAYTLVATADGEVIATAVQQLLPGQPIQNSLLLGTLTIELYNGTKIVRTTNVDDKSVSWLFTVTANGQTQEIEVGLRDKSEGNRKNYELFLAAQGQEYDVGVVFEQSSDRIFAEVYLNIVMSAYNYSMNYLDATLELTPITEAPAHVTGQTLPQSYLEQILENLLRQASRELNKATRELERAF